jgi:hypothetical protein
MDAFPFDLLPNKMFVRMLEPGKAVPVDFERLAMRPWALRKGPLNHH